MPTHGLASLSAHSDVGPIRCVNTLNQFTGLAAFVALALAGCGNAPNRPPTASVSVDTTPVLDIFDSRLADEPVFELPNGAARMSNGNIVVGDYYGMGHVFV